MGKNALRAVASVCLKLHLPCVVVGLCRHVNNTGACGVCDLGSAGIGTVGTVSGLGGVT